MRGWSFSISPDGRTIAFTSSTNDEDLADKKSAAGKTPPDLEKKLQCTRALMRLAAEDAEVDRLLAEVRSLLKPQSALREPELASRVMSMMAPA